MKERLKAVTRARRAVTSPAIAESESSPSPAGLESESSPSPWGRRTRVKSESRPSESESRQSQNDDTFRLNGGIGLVN